MNGLELHRLAAQVTRKETLDVIAHPMSWTEGQLKFRPGKLMRVVRLAISQGV